jgi:hypothetical protein
LKWEKKSKHDNPKDQNVPYKLQPKMQTFTKRISKYWKISKPITPKQCDELIALATQTKNLKSNSKEECKGVKQRTTQIINAKSNTKQFLNNND